MVSFKCFRCGYETTHKASLKTHLNRKNICNSILDDICVEEIKKWYNIDVSKNKQQIEPVLEQVKPVLEQVKPVFTKKQAKPRKTRQSKFSNRQKPGKTSFFEKIYTFLRFLWKNFTRAYGLTCHLKKCKKKNG